MNENDIAKKVVTCCFQIHQTIGPGIYEAVYEEILYYELLKAGLSVDRQREVSIVWDNLTLEKGFRADLIVENKVLIELKSVSELNAAHYKQVITYLRLSDIKLGLLINFNVAYIRDGIHRIVNGL